MIARMKARFLFFILAIGLGLLSANSMVRWMVVRRAPEIVGSAVTVGKVRTSLASQRIELRDVAVLDDQTPAQPTVSAKKVRLQLDRSGIARRQFVVESAHIEGMRVDFDKLKLLAGPTLSSSSTIEQPTSDDQLSLGAEVLSQAAQGADRPGMNLQSPGLSNEMIGQWEEQFDELEDLAQQTRKRITYLREYLRAAGQNPLRNIDEYRQAVSELESMPARSEAVKSALARFEQQMLMDKEKLSQSLNRDAALASDTVNPAQIDNLQMTRFLVASETFEQVANAMRWVKISRQLIPARNNGNEIRPMRGQHVDFPGMPPRGSLIRHLTFRGHALVAGESVSIEGNASNLGTISTEPGRFGIQTQDGAIAVSATMYNVNGELFDEFVLSCPNCEYPAQTLGADQRFALEMSPVQGSVKAKFEVHRDQIQGELLVRKRGVKLAPRVADTYGGAPVAQEMTRLLADIDTVETRTEIKGTIDNPRWTTHCDLSSHVSRALVAAYEAQSLEQRHHVVAAARDDVDGRIAAFELDLSARRPRWRNTLTHTNHTSTR